MREIAHYFVKPQYLAPTPAVVRWINANSLAQAKTLTAELLTH
jgi:hypothetical protein